MSLKHLYLLLCVIGAVLPLSQFIPWIVTYGPDVAFFFEQLLANAISRFFVFDVVVSALVLVTFIVAEGKHLAMEKCWIPIVATFGVGVSVGLPLFLYMRQTQLENRA